MSPNDAALHCLKMVLLSAVRAFQKHAGMPSCYPFISWPNKDHRKPLFVLEQIMNEQKSIQMSGGNIADKQAMS